LLTRRAPIARSRTDAGIKPLAETIRIERTGPVARFWLDRPDVRNALNGAVIRELAAAFAAIADEAQSGSVRVVVLGGSGKAFCAGADLAFMREMGGYTWEQNRADAEKLAAMLWTMFTCPVPVVARIHGDCYAGGLGLAAVCDIRIAADNATFCLSEARLGLLPATISPYVVRAVGEQAARRYFVTAERFDAAAARACGLVHEVVTAEALDPKVDEIVAAIVANGPMATIACKQLVQDVAGREITAELRSETARRIADIRASAEGQEGVKSFLEKRKPVWVAR
jgi:methylglutaconyl-CoA hydratase